MDAEQCISCGDTVPEGRMTCPKCDAVAKLKYEQCQHAWVFDNIVRGESGRMYFDYKCQLCGAHRLGRVYGGRAVMVDGK